MFGELGDIIALAKMPSQIKGETIMGDLKTEIMQDVASHVRESFQDPLRDEKLALEREELEIRKLELQIRKQAAQSKLGTKTQ